MTGERIMTFMVQQSRLMATWTGAIVDYARASAVIAHAVPGMGIAFWSNALAPDGERSGDDRHGATATFSAYRSPGGHASAQIIAGSKSLAPVGR